MSNNSISDITNAQKPATPSLLFRLLNCDFLNILFSYAKDNSSSAASPVACPESLNRNALLTTVYKQHVTKFKILEPYHRLKNALKNMQDEYLESRGNNVSSRYNQMKYMIKEVILLENQYWQLVEIPSQQSLEPSNTYVLKVINSLGEKAIQDTPVKKAGIASFFGPKTINVAPSTKYHNLLEKIRATSTEELRKECDYLYIELYKLIRKYLGLREVVQELSKSFFDTRFYPRLLRYPLLKTMIKKVLRAPAFAEICHEIND